MKGNRQITIGYDATAAMLGGGGIPRYTRELLRALVELEEPDLHFEVFANSLRRSPNEQLSFLDGRSNANLTHRRFPGPLLMKSWRTFRAPGIERLTGAPCDIVHFPANYFCPGRNATLATVHDLAFLEEDDEAAMGGRYFEKSFPALLPLATRVLTTSRHVATEVAKVYQVPAEKFHVTSAGVDLKTFTSAPQTHEPDLSSLVAGSPFVLCITDKSPRKRAQLIPQIAAILPDIRFLVVGFGGDPITDDDPANLTSLPRVSDLELAALYRRASLTLLTTRAEGFGFPLIESLACGTPVVCGKHSSFVEIGGEFADFASTETPEGFAQQINATLASERGDSWTQGVAIYVKQFDWKVIGRSMAEFYKEHVCGADADRNN